MKYILLPMVTMAFVACAHSAMRGSVVMKTAPNEAHVCLGKDEVKVGDKVALYKNQCVPKHCEKVKVGEGEVVELLNDHYSVVQAENVPFEEGYTVEKK